MRMRQLDVKEIKFCELVISGMDPAAAYIEAGFPGPSGMHAVTQSKKMLADAAIKSFLEEMHSNPEATEEDDIEPARMDRRFVLKEAWKSYKKAIMLGQMPAALKALEMIGSETAGLWKKEAKKAPGSGKSIKDMTLEELRAAALNIENESRLPRA